MVAQPVWSSVSSVCPLVPAGRGTEISGGRGLPLFCWENRTRRRKIIYYIDPSLTVPGILHFLISKVFSFLACIFFFLFSHLEVATESGVFGTFCTISLNLESYLQILTAALV